MRYEILIFDENEESISTIINTFNELFKEKIKKINYKLLKSKDVFEEKLPKKINLVFFNISNMYDVEALRKFKAFNENIPVIIISDSKEYGVVSWSLGANYYLLKPIHESDLLIAIKKSIRHMKNQDYYEKKILVYKGE